MKILICGGRNFPRTTPIYKELSNEFHIDYSYIKSRVKMLIDKRNPDMIIHGDAAGADTVVSNLIKSRYCIPTLAVPADWNKHGKAAGPIRNKKMLTYKPDLVVAFPGGRGTVNMMKQARLASIKVADLQLDYENYERNYDGTLLS